MACGDLDPSADRLAGCSLALAGRPCRIFVDDPAWLDHVVRSCARYRATAPASAARLYLVRRVEALPSDARALLGLADAADRPGPWVAQRAGASVSVEARKTLAVTPDLAVCWLRGAAPSPTSLYYNALHPLLIEWLARSGALYVHAGAIELADAGPLLIAGPRHAGKTTTCLALLVAGRARLLGDDTALIDERGALHTLLRPMHPERRLCEGWSPQLARHGIAVDRLDRLGDDRVDLDPARWFAGCLVDRLAPPRAVILPWADDGAATRCERAEPSHTAAVLFAQIHAGVPPIAPAHAERIAALVALPALRLRIGRDAFADPAGLVGALQHGLEERRR